GPCAGPCAGPRASPWAGPWAGAVVLVCAGASVGAGAGAVAVAVAVRRTRVAAVPVPARGVGQCEHCRIRGHDHAVAGEPQRGGLGDEDRHRDDYYDYYDYYDHDHHHDDDSGDGARLRGQSSRLGVVNGALLQLLQVGPLLHRVRGLRPELVLAGLHQECQRPGGEREGDE
ncbi:unnamed protein product, partial [Prorocentrum cordatum]